MWPPSSYPSNWPLFWTKSLWTVWHKPWCGCLNRVDGILAKSPTEEGKWRFRFRIFPWFFHIPMVSKFSNPVVVTILSHVQCRAMSSHLEGWKAQLCTCCPPRSFAKGRMDFCWFKALSPRMGVTKKKHPGYRPWTSMGEQDDGILWWTLIIVHLHNRTWHFYDIVSCVYLYDGKRMKENMFLKGKQ